MPGPKEEPREREAGRSFDDPSRPLGSDLIEKAARTPERVTTVYNRATPHEYRPPHGVADRAKGVAVLRKAEELMYTHNPAPTSAAATRRALELAAGRLGLSLAEYDTLVRGDPELQELERKVIADAIARLRR